MRRFEMHRHTDVTGVSGGGKVAEGVLFSTGKVVIQWLTATSSLVVWENLADAIKVHGHDGKTEFRFLDPDEA